MQKLVDNIINELYAANEKMQFVFPVNEVVKIVERVAEEYNDGWILCSKEMPPERESTFAEFRDRKGIALLVEHFDSLRRNPHYIRKVADDEYNRFYANGSVDYETRIEEIYKSVQSTIDSCFSYLANILSVMVIEGKKYVDAEWI